MDNPMITEAAPRVQSVKRKIQYTTWIGVVDDPDARPWAANAKDLASWAWSLLINRTDVWGGYNDLDAGGEPVTRPAKRDRGKVQLDKADLVQHFRAHNRSRIVGLHSTSPENTSRWAGIDIDAHGLVTAKVKANNRRAALAWYNKLRDMGLRPLLVSSNGLGGYHIWIIFSVPVATADAYTLGEWLKSDHADYGLPTAPEHFPKQVAVPADGYGNWQRLPGRHHTDDYWSSCWDGDKWLSGQAAIDHVLSIAGDDPALLPWHEIRAAAPIRITEPASRSEPAVSVIGDDDQLDVRARAYLDRVPNRVEGEGRDNAAYTAACFLVRDMNLPAGRALDYLDSWDRGNTPPLGSTRLSEIIEHARAYGRRPAGSALTKTEEKSRKEEGRTMGKSEENREETQITTNLPYQVKDGVIVRLEGTKNGDVNHHPLCNFSARIVTQTTVDDGVEQQITLAIEGQLADGTALARVDVPAAGFAGMSWVVERWGTRAIVNAGNGTRDHLRAAMQHLSCHSTTRTVYGHTGWRLIGGEWAYLHAGGAVGTGGAVANVEIQLPSVLTNYALPQQPPTDEELRDAVCASLRMMGVAPLSVTAPTYAAVWRSVLATADFTLHVSGPTGQGKSELAALCQQHFGPGLDARHLPGSWASTGNSLEALAFVAKDALLVVDDFAPGGSVHDVARAHREADRLLRAQGNRAGRSRCRADGSFRAAKPPRGLILSTGEDVPRGQSLRSRMLILEFTPDSMCWDKLTQAQSDAATGKYAAAMSGYLHWLAPRIEAINRDLPRTVAALRDELRTDGQHARTPGIVAELFMGLRYFLDFAQEAGAISADKRQRIEMKCRRALLAAAAEQTSHGLEAEPVDKFLRLLSAALASGRCHVADAKGEPMKQPQAWGWMWEGGVWRPNGTRIGWLAGEDLYLEPEASYAAVQKLACDQGDSFNVNGQTLRRRLKEKGVLVSTESNKTTTRRRLQGRDHAVLHLRSEALQRLPEQGEPGDEP